MSGASPGVLALCDPQDRQQRGRPTVARGGDETRLVQELVGPLSPVPLLGRLLASRLPPASCSLGCLFQSHTPLTRLRRSQQTPLASALQAVGSRVSRHLGKGPAARSLPHLRASEGPLSLRASCCGLLRSPSPHSSRSASTPQWARKHL